MVNRVPLRILEEKILQLQKLGVKYTFEHTRGRFHIKAEGRWGEWMNEESSFKPGELHFIKQVKQHIIKNETYKNVRNMFKKEGSTDRIKYNYFSKKLKQGDRFENLWEIDIKKAYFTTAYQMNLFDKAIYEKGLNMSKKTILASIGSLNKVKHIIEFDGKKEYEKDPVKSDITGFLWHTISHKIGKQMAKACKIAKDNFLFFWVDAIFMQGSEVDAKNIADFFTKQGYECTVVKCEWLEVGKEKLTVKCTAKKKKVTKIVETKEIINGRSYIRRKKVVTWVDERPFSKRVGMSETDIMNLAQ